MIASRRTVKANIQKLKHEQYLWKPAKNRLYKQE